MEVSRSYLFDSYIATVQGGVVRRRPHRHAALQLTVSLDGTPHRVGATLQCASSGLVHLVGSNVAHAFGGGDGAQVLLWLPPESSVARQLGHTYLQDGGIVQLAEGQMQDLPLAALRDALHEAVPPPRVHTETSALLSALARCTTSPPAPLHPGVRKALRIIHALDTARISADELATRVGLSKDRLQHVFTREMGIPLRPYLQWLRCIDALALLAQGHSATAAALAAGFTDGAHCNRVLKRYVCLSPSAFSAPHLHVARYRSMQPD